ncbi:spingomyelin synthetase-like protein, partial [Dinothrombium tinctorium]
INNKDEIAIEVNESIESKDQAHDQPNENVNSYSIYDYLRTFLALLLFIASGFANDFALAIVHEFVPYKSPPLPDLGFSLLPYEKKMLDVCEFIIIGFGVAVVLLHFFHSYRIIVFTRMLTILSIIYLCRSICMVTTIFPLAHQRYCAPRLKDANGSNFFTFNHLLVFLKRAVHLLSGFGLSINGKQVYCGDYLFSGHTAILVAFYLILREYWLPAKCETLIWKVVNYSLQAIVFFAILDLIMARGHYLIDIVLGYYVTTRVFWIYHTFAYNNQLIQKSKIAKVWWLPLFKYFERIPNDRQLNCNIHITRDQCDCIITNGIIPRSFKWPLYWPTFLNKEQSDRQRLLP